MFFADAPSSDEYGGIAGENFEIGDAADDYATGGGDSALA
jgi:hypothetical protein